MDGTYWQELLKPSHEILIVVLEILIVEQIIREEIYKNSPIRTQNTDPRRSPIQLQLENHCKLNKNPLQTLLR